jgi:hypothetical protein
MGSAHPTLAPPAEVFIVQQTNTHRNHSIQLGNVPDEELGHAPGLVSKTLSYSWTLQVEAYTIAAVTIPRHLLTQEH